MYVGEKASAVSTKESGLKTAISNRDNEIAELKAENEALKVTDKNDEDKRSSGDPIQDWVDSLGK